MRSLPYRPELDGLRVLGVVPFVLRANAVGFSIFFVLSGALLTQLLLHEHTGWESIAFGRFWVRRARRLLPAAIAMAIASALVRAPIDRDAFAVYAAFTIAWPLVLSLLWRIGRSAAALALALFVLAWNALRVHGLAIDVPADALAIGCLAGIGVRLGATRARTVLVWIAPLAIGALALIVRTAWSSPWPIPSVLAAIVVIRLFVAPSSVLSWEPLVVLGRLAYGFYLWHLPVFAFVEAHRWPWLATLPIAGTLAAATHWGIERPLRAK